MSSEQDNGHYNDGLTNLTLMYEREGYFDDERELQMEQEMERIDALGGYDDEPVRVEEEDDFFPEYLTDIEPEPERISNVTLNGSPVYMDSFEDESEF